MDLKTEKHFSVSNFKVLVNHTTQNWQKNKHNKVLNYTVIIYYNIFMLYLLPSKLTYTVNQKLVKNARSDGSRS